MNIDEVLNKFKYKHSFEDWVGILSNESTGNIAVIRLSEDNDKMIEAILTAVGEDECENEVTIQSYEWEEKIQSQSIKFNIQVGEPENNFYGNFKLELMPIY